MGLDKIQSEIKNTAVELEKVNSGIEDFTGKVSAIVKEAAAALKELKKAANFTELHKAAEITTKNQMFFQ
jgi:hypothetical protein